MPRKPGKRAYEVHEILESMPEDPESIQAYFDAMDRVKFDAVWPTLVMEFMVLERDESGRITPMNANAIFAMLSAVRKRYRRIMVGFVNPLENQTVGERNHRAKANEVQVRIIRRLPRSRPGMKGPMTARAVGEMFGLHFSIVREIWNGKSWKHLSDRDLDRIQPCSSAKNASTAIAPKARKATRSLS